MLHDERLLLPYVLGNSGNFFTNYSYWQAVRVGGEIVSMGSHTDTIKVGEDGVAHFVNRVVQVFVKHKKKRNRNRRERTGPTFDPALTVFIAGKGLRGHDNETLEASLGTLFEKLGGKPEVYDLRRTHGFVVFADAETCDKVLAAATDKTELNGEPLAIERKVNKVVEASE